MLTGEFPQLIATCQFDKLTGIGLLIFPPERVGAKRQRRRAKEESKSREPYLTFAFRLSPFERGGGVKRLIVLPKIAYSTPTIFRQTRFIIALIIALHLDNIGHWCPSVRFHQIVIISFVIAIIWYVDR